MEQSETEFKAPDNMLKPTLEMKKRAVKYYNANMVPKHLEELLNRMFLENPADLYGYMSEYFGALANEPIISKISLERCFGSNSSLSGRGKLFCTVFGNEKFVIDLPFFVDDGSQMEPVKIKLKSPTSSRGKKEKAPTEPVVKPDTTKPKTFDFVAFYLLLEEMSQKLQSVEICNQEEFDAVLSKLRSDYLLDENELVKTGSESIPAIETSDEQGQIENRDSKLSNTCVDCTEQQSLKRTHTDTSTLYLSLLAAHGTCSLRKYSLSDHLLPLFRMENTDRLLPVPLVPILSAGVTSPGKLNMLKTVYILPKPDSNYAQTLINLTSMVRELGSILAHKFGAQGYLLDDDKLHFPPFERVDQVFEVIHGALGTKNLCIDDFYFVLDVAASDFYDEDKKKYEISAGQHKTSDDMIAMYSELVEKHAVVGIIDGLSHKDMDHWQSLNAQLGSRCHIIGDKLINNSLDNLERCMSEKLCNGCRFSISSFNCFSLSHLRDLLSSLRDSGAVVMMSTKAGNLSNLSISDAVHVAVAAQNLFVDIGSPLQPTNIPNYNILIEYERAGCLSHRECFEFHVLTNEDDETETENQGDV